ncbi:MAG: 4Fe-4S dicluster domain-containing protein [Thermodesulfobacteriota bacterium]
MKRIFINEEFCIGCRLCEIYCLVQHSKSKEIIKAFKKETPRALPRILVEQKGTVSFALQCRHCEEPHCLEACMTGALYRDEKTGAILHHQEQCVGCWMCVMVCPYGAIQRDLNGKKVASKCDLCGGKETPVCVKKCPNEALKWREV